MDDETMIKSTPEAANEPDDWSTFDFSSVDDSRKNHKPFFAKKSVAYTKKTASKIAQNSPEKAARGEADLAQKFELARAEKNSENFAKNNAKTAADMAENDLDILANSIKNDAEILAKVLPENRARKNKKARQKSRAKTAGTAYFLAAGFAAGAAIWALNLFVNYAFLRPAICGDVNVSKLCANSDLIAFFAASVAVGLLVFSLFRAYKIARAFLVSVATIVAFGALFLLISGLKNGGFAVLVSGVFGALIMAFFARVFAAKNAFFASVFAAIFVVAFWLFVRA